jgi:hypothetical protein
MNERQPTQAADSPPVPPRRDAYRETLAETPAADGAATTDVYQERVSGLAGDQVTHSEHVSIPSPAANQRAGVDRITQAIYFIFGVINVLLLLRLVLLLLGAQEASAFVSLIYGASHPLVLPFQGIFAEASVGGAVLEWASLVGIAVYSLIAYGITRAITLLYAPAQPSVGRMR